jgi:hypothetical protein
MLSTKIKHSLITAGIALTTTVVGTSAMVLTLGGLSSWFIRTPLDLGSPANWVFWSLGIGLGVWCMVTSFRLGKRTRRSSIEEDETLRKGAGRTAASCALGGLGLGALWFVAWQISLALVAAFFS